MSLIKELQQLIQTESPISGRVVSVSNNSVVVATASGQMEVSTTGDLQPENLVTIEAGVATKKQRGSEVRVYYV